MAEQQVDIRVIKEVADINSFKVRGNRILLKTSESDAPRTVGGIVIPEATADRMLKEGTIIYTGEQVQTLKAGDTVFYYKNTTEGSVREGTVIYFWISDYNIIAVLDSQPLIVQADGEITG